ncbi:MAG TPA: MG2 domain-containing protein [Pyrinomonadaceae bacterium]
MRRSIWVFLILCLFTVPLLLSSSTNAGATLRVNETATRFLFEKERTGPLLVVENSLGRRLEAHVQVELLDPQGSVRASAGEDVTITEGAAQLFVSLPFRPSDLKAAERQQLLWYRLRYSITPRNSSNRAEQTEGIISLSVIAPDIFEVRVISSSYAKEDSLYRAHVRAAHPLTGRAVQGVEIEARLKIDEEGDKRSTILAASGVTNAEGYLTLDFRLPRGIKADGADFEVTARRGLFVQEGSDRIHFDQLSRIYISTDKPLYQPGQMLHARVLVLSPTKQAMADQATRFKIEDPEGTVVFRAELKTSRFGVASADWPIPENTRLGEYTISFGREDESYAFLRVKISRYDLPNFTTQVKPDQSFYLPGQNAEVIVRADYLFGQPVRRGRVRVVRETEREWNYREQKWETKEGEKYEGETDAGGRFVARVNLRQEHADLKESEWSRFKDVTYAAYFTDASTGRTEQRRFDLRVTKEPIHVYVVGDTYDQSSRLPLEFYASTFYADGTPAQCDVLISKGSEDDKSLESPRGRAAGRRVATFRTNSYGLAKVSLPKPPLDEDDSRVYLRFAARDARGRAGHKNEEFSYEDEPAIRVKTDKTLYRAGEPVRLNIIASEKDLNVIVDVSRDSQVLRSDAVRLRDGRATMTIPYDGRFRDELTITAYANVDTREEIYGGRYILYPRDKDLKLDVRPDQTTYRPGEEAHVGVNVRAPDGQVIESALGVVVFDRAVEERARNDQEFGSNSTVFGNYGNLLGWDDSVAGVSRRELERLDLSKPLPAGLELLADVLLNRNGYYGPNTFGGNDFDLDQQKVFADLTNRQLKPLQDALNARYRSRMEYPKDEATLRSMLKEAGISFEALLDPWGTPYRALFYVRLGNNLLSIESAGADKRFGTADDFSASAFTWPYFRPVGEMIDRAVQQFHARTGGYIRDLATLRSELLRDGVDFASLRDPWGGPYRVTFEAQGVHYILKVWSGGPDKRFGPASRNDDFFLWSAMIDYFAERRAEIDAALGAYLKETRRFPQDVKELDAALKKSKIDFASLRDAWGRPFYAAFRTESRFTDRVNIEARQQYGDKEKPQARTVVMPVTQKVGILMLRSAGPDGKAGTPDDFDAGTFSLILSEQDRNAPQAVAASAAPILTGKGGAIVGTVLDTNGGAVPNAKVKATSSSTSLFYEATTDDEGKYLLRDLPAGIYEVRTTASGFAETVVTNVLVSSTNILTLDITLQPGGEVSAVTVTAASDQVETSITSLSVSGNRGRSNNFILLEAGKNSGAVVNVITKSGTKDRSMETSTPRLREYFPETLLWQPLLETDARGRAELSFKLADNITTWKLAIIGSTVEGEIGMAEREILAFQPFFVEHDPPRVLTEGDEIQLPVVLRNYLNKAQAVNLAIKPESWFELLGPAEKRAEVAAGDNSRQTFDFRAVATIKDGKQRITARGASASDEIERAVSVHPDGEEIAKTAAGILTDSATLEANIPENAIKGTERVELRLYPNLMAHVTESIEAIMRRPYGCAEQAISAAYPSLLALRIYKRTGREQSAGAKARRYVQAGYERLLNYRAGSGGFSYWGRGDADLALTAYALRFLHEAAEFIEIDVGVIKEAREWLVKQQRGDGSWPARLPWEKTEDARRTGLLTAYIARVLAMTKDRDADDQKADEKAAPLAISAPLKRALHYLSGRYQEIDEPYLIASYALAALDAGDAGGAKMAIEKLRSLAREEAGTFYWSLETNTPFYGWGLAGRIETTALALQALSKYCGMRNADCGLEEPASPNPQSAFRIPQLLNGGLLFLLRQKDRYGVWYSTQATVNVLDAIATLLLKDASGAGADAEVFVNGKMATAIKLPPDDVLANPITVDLSRFVSSGSNRIEIRRNGAASHASAQVVATYYVPWSAAKGAANHPRAEDPARTLRLGVSYDRSVAATGSEITCRVEAERIGFRGYGMLLAEIGLPPGADVDRASLEKAMKDSGWGLSQYDVLPDRLIVYLWPQAGGTKFDFKFRPRYGLAAQTAPSVLYDYYNPEARVTLAPTKFMVK